MESAVLRNFQTSALRCFNTKESRSRTSWLRRHQAAQCTPSSQNSCTRACLAARREWWVFSRFRMGRRFRLCHNRFKRMTPCSTCNSGGNKSTSLVARTTPPTTTCCRRSRTQMTPDRCVLNTAIARAAATASAQIRPRSRVCQK